MLLSPALNFPFSSKYLIIVEFKYMEFPNGLEWTFSKYLIIVEFKSVNVTATVTQ